MWGGVFVVVVVVGVLGCGLFVLFTSVASPSVFEGEAYTSAGYVAFAVCVTV